MKSHVVTLARRRPGLVLLVVLYAAIAGLVARSPLTVALCTVVLMSVVLQVALVVRGRRVDHLVDPS